ncbi:hypothetical protein HPP92_008146 [Vanilla planifolia]|uniref:phosphoribosylglycinamide formyltransferase 1 n=1 Tax=Vanilla planifolia TaxID=51239 RepID=A0A835RBR1_VANPL|nr:hypothetical protein HPP92_008146 [Vanilla planifolia]
MKAMRLTLGTQVPPSIVVNSLMQNSQTLGLPIVYYQQLNFEMIRHHGNITLRRQSRGSKDLQCRNNLCKASNFVEEYFGSVTSIRRKRLAIFVSGGGSNFRSIHNATINGLINGDIVVLVTNKTGCGGAEYARNYDIPVILYPKLKESMEGLSSIDLVNSLRKFEVDFVLLAGYLKLIPIELIQAYPRSIVNIHPSLLPAFGGKGYYGLKVHKAVIASGARYSGPTVHFVDEHYDTGKILSQKVVPVFLLMTPQNSWLQEFFKRNTNFMWKQYLHYVKKE